MPQKQLALWAVREGKGGGMGDLEIAGKLSEFFASVFTTDHFGEIPLHERPFLTNELNQIQVILLEPQMSPGGLLRKPRNGQQGLKWEGAFFQQ